MIQAIPKIQLTEVIAKKTVDRSNSENTVDRIAKIQLIQAIPKIQLTEVIAKKQLIQAIAKIRRHTSN